MRTECIAFVVIVISTFVSKGTSTEAPSTSVAPSGENRSLIEKEENEHVRMTNKNYTKRQTDDSLDTDKHTDTDTDTDKITNTDTDTDTDTNTDTNTDTDYDSETTKSKITEPKMDAEYYSDTEDKTRANERVTNEMPEKRSTGGSNLVSRSRQSKLNYDRNKLKKIYGIPLNRNANPEHDTKIEAKTKEESSPSDTENSSSTTITALFKRLVQKLISHYAISELEDKKQDLNLEDKLSCSYNGKPVITDDERIKRAFEELRDTLKVQHQTENPTARSSIDTCPSIRNLHKSQKYIDQSYNMTKQIISWKQKRNRKACTVTRDINDHIKLLFHISKMLRKKTRKAYKHYRDETKIKGSRIYEPNNPNVNNNPYVNYNEWRSRTKGDNLMNPKFPEYCYEVLNSFDSTNGQNVYRNCIQQCTKENPNLRYSVENPSFKRQSIQRRPSLKSWNILPYQDNWEKIFDNPESSGRADDNSIVLIPLAKYSEEGESPEEIQMGQNTNIDRSNNIYLNKSQPSLNSNKTALKIHETSAKAMDNEAAQAQNYENINKFSDSPHFAINKNGYNSWLPKRGRSYNTKEYPKRPRVFALLPPTADESNLEKELMKSLKDEYYVPIPMKYLNYVPRN